MEELLKSSFLLSISICILVKEKYLLYNRLESRGWHARSSIFIIGIYYHH